MKVRDNSDIGKGIKNAARDYPAALESVTGGELRGECPTIMLRDLAIDDGRALAQIVMIRIRARGLKAGGRRVK